MVSHVHNRLRGAKNISSRGSSRVTTPSVAHSIAITVSGNGFRRPFAIWRRNPGFSPSLSALVSFMARLIATPQWGVKTDKSGWHSNTETPSRTKHTIRFFLI